MITIYVVGAICFAVGYAGGRWNGVVHERDTLRDLNEEMRLRQHVVWHGDGRYSPSCEACGWEGRPRANHADTRAAVLAHMRTKRHQDQVRLRKLENR